jgi:hypothetical protein
VTLHKLAAHPGTAGEDSEDLREWLHRLTGCPPLQASAMLSCRNPVHGTEPATWFFVEADAQAGVARHRCVGCAEVQSLLDSAEHWTYPPMHSCGDCGQSMVELAVGLHTDPGSAGASARVSWLVLAGRCVACGRIDGLTDLVVDAAAVEDLIEAL